LDPAQAGHDRLSATADLVTVSCEIKSCAHKFAVAADLFARACVTRLRLCLRDLRDAAVDDASRAKSELRQLRQQHEELLLSSRESASRSDVAHSELVGELKLKGFELARLQVGAVCVLHPCRYW
jgi:hypothetical protein